MLLEYACKDAHSCSRWPTRPGYRMLARRLLQHLYQTKGVLWSATWLCLLCLCLQGLLDTLLTAPASMPCVA